MAIEYAACYMPVADESSVTGDIFLPANKEYKLTIDYPLETKAEFTIKTGKNGLGTLGVVEKIRVIYRKIYANEEKYGVYGHDISDLTIEGIRVDHRKKQIEVEVGS